MNKETTESYHLSQLNRIDTGSIYPAKFRVFGGEGGNTNHMDFNKESINDLLTWLKQRYPEYTERISNQ